MESEGEKSILFQIGAPRWLFFYFNLGLPPEAFPRHDRVCLERCAISNWLGVSEGGLTTWKATNPSMKLLQVCGVVGRSEPHQSAYGTLFV